MALFSRKQNTEVKKEAAERTAPHTTHDLSWVLVKPHITEKATDVNAARAYVFLVDERANKRLVAQAVKEVYKVHPVRVNMTGISTKTVRSARTGMKSIKGGGKKAYVYLKEGDSINLI